MVVPEVSLPSGTTPPSIGGVAMAVPTHGEYVSRPKPGVCMYCRAIVARTYESDTTGKRICARHLETIVFGGRPKPGEKI